MKEHRSIPLPLQIVAVLFLLGGIGSVIGMVVRYGSNVTDIDLGILGIPTYFGLRRFSTGWRTFALVCIWVALIMCPIAFVFGFVAEGPAAITTYGTRVAFISPIWLSVISVPLFLLELWQYRVLTAPKIRELFYADQNPPGVAQPCGANPSDNHSPGLPQS